MVLKNFHRVPLLKCGICQLVFAAQIPTASQLESYYSNYGQGHYLSPLTLKRYHQWLNDFEPFRQTKNMLDIGCGKGYFLDEAKKRGWNVYGTEYSEALVKSCREKEITMHLGGLAVEIFPAVQFDVILSIEVIEHINNPNEELQIIQSLLRQGGMFYCTTPNFNSLERRWLGDKYNVISWPEHLTYYSAATLRRTIEKHGFEARKVSTLGMSITRFRLSRGKTSQPVVSAKSDDEVIRNMAERNFFLKWGKSALNFFLNLTRTGMSLKGWFVLARK